MYKCNCWSYLQHTLNNPIDTSSALGVNGSMKETGMHVFITRVLFHDLLSIK